MIDQKEIAIAKTPLDIPIVLFVGSQLVSALFSMDSHVSWFGYYSRFNGGMWSILSYVLLFYAFVSNKVAILPTLIGALATGAIVATYGVLEHLGIDKHLWVQDVQNRVFSTLGQPNWLAAYLVALSPIAMGFATFQKKLPSLKESIGKRFIFGWLHIGVIALFFTVLLFTRSRSGLIGFAAADILFWALLLLKTKDFLSVRVPFIVCHILFAIIVFVNGTAIEQVDRYFTLSGLQQAKDTVQIEETNEVPPSGYTAPLLEYGGTESGTIRKYVWQGAIQAWQATFKTMLIGTGTETFAFAFYQHRPEGHNLTSEWDFLYNKAHNEYLNYLTTTGLFGLSSYLLLIGVFAFWFLKTYGMLPSAKKEKETHADHMTIHIALFAGWASILVTNFFGFSVVILQIFFFLFPALLLSQSTLMFRSRSLRSAPYLNWVMLLACIVVVGLIGRAWWADVLFAKGYRNARLGQYLIAQESLASAIAINPSEPLYHDEASSVFSLLASTSIESQDATAAAEYARASIRESDAALSISPNNVNYWKTRTKILYAFTPFDPTFIKAAITALQKARELSPNDPKILYNLAVLQGQDGDNDRAIELLSEAVSLKPNYRDAYWALSIFYNEKNQSELAKSTLSEYLTKVDPNDREFQEALAR